MFPARTRGLDRPDAGLLGRRDEPLHEQKPNALGPGAFCHVDAVFDEEMGEAHGSPCGRAGRRAGRAEGELAKKAIKADEAAKPDARPGDGGMIIVLQEPGPRFLRTWPVARGASWRHRKWVGQA